MTRNKILSDSVPETETEAEPEAQSEEPQPEPVLACRCGIELPKKLKIVGGTDVLRVSFPLSRTVMTRVSKGNGHLIRLGKSLD